jgi:hypothetical protein
VNLFFFLLNTEINNILLIKCTLNIVLQVTIFGQSSGGTSIFALLASPLCKDLFHRAWMLSGSPILNKTTNDAFKDNELFMRNTNCTNVDCLYSLSSAEVTFAVPWTSYPYWAMFDQGDLPTKGHFDGALAIVDGNLIRVRSECCHWYMENMYMYLSNCIPIW